MLTCDNCQRPYDPVGRRWKCPHCGFKAHCCEGAPQPENPGDLSTETLTPATKRTQLTG